MDYEKIDRPIMRFFVILARHMQRVDIPTSTAVNVFVTIQIISQIAHPIVLHYEGKSMEAISWLSIPTTIFVLYLIWVVKISQTRPVGIDAARIFSGLLAIITTFNFVHVCIVDSIIAEHSFTENLLGDTMHLVTTISFMLVMHFASVPDPELVEKDKRLKA